MNTRRIGAVPKSALWSGLKGGIFDAKHTKAMGSAIWLFGYLCMRQTQLNENGEGLPRYGNPTSTADIARDTGWTRSQIEHWMRKLVRAGYIRTMGRGSHDGVVIFIAKAKKKQRVCKEPGSVMPSSAKSAEETASHPPNPRRSGPVLREIREGESGNSFKNQGVASPPTKPLSYSETPSYYNTTAAPVGADSFSCSLKALAEEKSIPRDGLSQGQYVGRKNLLLGQRQKLETEQRLAAMKAQAGQAWDNSRSNSD